MRAAKDALVLRALAQTLTPILEPHIPPACTHIVGHGGAKGAIRQVLAALPNYRFVFKTDVRGYYASIDQHLLFDQLAAIIDDRAVLRLLWNAINRITWDDGSYREHARGIALGCPLSPLLGGLHLAHVDRVMTECGGFYVRFMDDLLFLAPSRACLRRVVKLLHGQFAPLRLEMHPDKTFIGRIDKGFDFLGYHFDFERRETPPPLQLGEVESSPMVVGSGAMDPSTKPENWEAPSLSLALAPCLVLLLSPARAAWAGFIEKCRRLYERGADSIRIGGYWVRWLLWFHGHRIS
jgi:hypothetical protein